MGTEIFSININSLLDVLTVLLFFLLKSSNMSTSLQDPPKGLRLPASHADVKPEETSTVALASDRLYFNNKPVVTLQSHTFRSSDVGRDGRTIGKLKALLDKENQKRIAVFKDLDPTLIPPGKILIQADKMLTFGTVKYLLHTLTLSGYSNYQFVVKDTKKN